MYNESGERGAPLGGGASVKRRGLFKLGALASAITGAFAVSGVEAGPAQAAGHPGLAATALGAIDLSATYDPIGAGALAQTAAATDATSKVTAHAGNASAHARIQITDVLINRTVNGPPNDSMFTNPTDGMEVVDTANFRKWVRIGGNWVYTALGSTAVFTPAAVSGLVAWYDASQIVGLADGASVPRWNDLSGNGNNLTQGIAANQPVYKTAIQNGKAVVRFNGSSSVMSKTLGVALKAPYTVILVGRASSGTSANECFWSGGNSTFLEGRTNGKYQTQSGSAVFAQIGTGVKLNAFVALSAIFSITPSLRVNGVELDGSWSSCANATSIYVGAVNGLGDWLNGDIGELLVYNRALTNTELLQIEGYLS
ncbi:hypothetical protein [Arthrobacter sp. FW306-2-2C-D06B]|uniref:hypothetical protein n=1 Tax=Arthrobacter sp. FW306-2-2C-D06B TaxID=2879618 RepID=UPI001F1E67EF|nr:hypothetical protein [Arthrobacter sp. FW306-2-2C-D06B]UKA57985.1 hypothetical protein LFT47_17140 [Arthrobacter sp. FW306-2-2C-D06B]